MNLKENINRIKEVMKIDEQNHTLPQDTVASQSLIQSSSPVNSTPTKLLYLTPRNAQGQVTGNKLTYAISGTYSIFGFGGGSFNVTMRNIKRLASGNLYAEVKPDNEDAYSTMKTLVPNAHLTAADKWLVVNVPTAKINDAINQLKSSSVANINAGLGVSITLKNV